MFFPHKEGVRLARVDQLEAAFARRRRQAQLEDLVVAAKVRARGSIAS